METRLYYPQSRYYDPELARFINADVLVSTGQGIWGNNMFAYCRSNPVSREDKSGTEDVCAVDFNQDNNPLNDLGNPSGGSSGVSIRGAFSRTLKDAAKGHEMASGQRGRHTNAYHTFITTAIEALDVIANGNLEMYIDGMEMPGEFIKAFWWIPYAQKK